jgi:hypothetical protein
MAGLASAPGVDLAKATSAFLMERLHLSAEEASVSDARCLRPHASSPTRFRIWIQVSGSAQADAVVGSRHLLKGSGITVFDDLSPDEQAAHRLLWPRYLEALRSGFTAQFNRARLVINGLAVV